MCQKNKLIQCCDKIYGIAKMLLNPVSQPTFFILNKDNFYLDMLLFTAFLRYLIKTDIQIKIFSTNINSDNT